MEFLLIVMLTVSSYVDSTAIEKNTSAIQSSKNTDKFEPWKKIYLPQTIQPTSYELRLTPNFYNDTSFFHGNILIGFKVLKDTNTILVHSRNLVITFTTLQICEQVVNVTRAFQYEEYWVVQTKESIKASLPTCSNSLGLGFRGILTNPEDLAHPVFGFHKGTYVDERTGKRSWYVATDFEPSSSRTAFPNLDEPQFKAPFKVGIKHRKNFIALSNEDKENPEPEDIGGNWHYTAFKLTPNMSSYLVSFIISDFSFKANRLVGGQLNRVWARPDRLDKVDYALSVTPALENYLRKEFDIAYPLTKLDQFALPTFSADGMESWGLITYRESILLVDVMKGGDIAKTKCASTIAHELAHFYFGNFVTCRSWNHLWLNEGFATFYQVRAMTAVYPTLFHKEQYFAEKLEAIMSQDATDTTDPLVTVLSSLPITTRYLFNDLCYVKGGAIARMVEGFMGAEPFRSGIQRYLKDNIYKAVETSHLWAALQQNITEPDLNLTETMKTWVYRTGFPVIVVLPLFGNEFVAIQEPFRTDVSDGNDCRHIWHVPLNYRTKGGNTGLVWVKSTHVTFEIPLNSNDDWIQFNHDASGYYRVNYHPTLWERLAKQLYDDYTVFAEIARWKLLSDAAILVKTEQMSYDGFLSLARYASEERGVGPWRRIFIIIKDIYEMIANTTTIISRFKRYILNLTTSLMDELQVKDDEGPVNDFRQLRPEIMLLSCSAGHRGCITNTTRMFKAWLRNSKSNAIPANFRRNAYCIGVANSELESEWNTVYERFKARKELDLLNALACSRNVTLLTRLLQHVINDKKMDHSGIKMAISGIAMNPASEGLVFKWLKFNDTSIDTEKYHTRLMIEATARAVRTRDLREEVCDFLESHTYAKRGNLRGIMDGNIRWMDKNFPSIESWLERNVS